MMVPGEVRHLKKSSGPFARLQANFNLVQDLIDLGQGVNCVVRARVQQFAMRLL